ncbi:MAG: hypothetical protein RI885_1950 [Actinomycetota bacterium]
MSIPAGWYADQTDPQSLRWWDGAQWTEHVTSAVAPGAAEADVAAAAAAVAVPGTASDAAPPAPVPPNRTGMWVAIGAGGLALLLLVGAGLFYVGARAVGSLADQGDGSSSSDSDPRPDIEGGGERTPDDDAVFDLDVVDRLAAPTVPTGWGVDDANPRSGSDEVSGVLGLYDGIPVSPADCAALTFYEAVSLNDSGVDDIVSDLGSWVDDSGSGSLTATVRRFDTVDDAAAQVDSLNSTIATCSAGYSGDGFQSSGVTVGALDSSSDAIDGASWTETGVNTPVSDDGADPEADPAAPSDEVIPWVFEAADIRRGNLVVRGTCFQTADVADPAVCAEFFAALADDLDRL